MALCIASGGRMLYIFRLIVNAVSLGAPICRSVYLPSPLLFLNQALIIHSLSLFIQLSLSLSLYVDLLLCLCLCLCLSFSLSHAIHSPPLPPIPQGGELSRRFQLCGGRPDIAGVHGRSPVVGRAARHHLRGRAQELPSQVGETLVNDVKVRSAK